MRNHKATHNYCSLLFLLSPSSFLFLAFLNQYLFLAYSSFLFSLKNQSPPAEIAYDPSYQREAVQWWKLLFRYV